MNKLTKTINVKDVIDEDFINYKKPNMFVATSTCTFKCEKEDCNVHCQNSKIVKQKTIKENLNVRQLEALVQRLNENVPRETKKIDKDIFTLEKESELRELFGTAVKITKNNEKEKGKIEIEFYSKDDLERILKLLED